MKGKRHQERAVGKNTQCLHMVEIRHVITPGADSRLSHAIEILLRSAEKEPKGSINAKKKRKSHLKIAGLKG